MNQPASADPSDVIVGSWRALKSIRRVPATVWLFAAAALADLFIRAVTFGATFETAQSRPGDDLILLLSGLPAAAFVFLPGASLLGTWPRRTARLVFIGAALLALAEIVSLAGTVVVFGRFSGGGPLDAFDLFARARSVDSVTLVGSVFSLAGVSVLTVTVAQIRPGSARGGVARTVAGLVLAIAVAGALAGAVTEARWFSSYTASLDPLSGPGFITLPALLANGIGIVAGVGWGALAALAIVGRAGASAKRRGWTLLSAGATFLVIADAISAFVMTLGANATGATALYQLRSTASLIGVACLVAALATGLRTEPDELPRTVNAGPNLL
jgi:hypothetical protein